MEREFEGKLKEITAINSITSKDGKLSFIETIFTLQEGEGKKGHMRNDIRYRGVLLPDSIGNEITVTVGTGEDPDGVTKVYDKTLRRTYSVLETQNV